MTTYSVDPAFYDYYVARSLRRSGCENIVLLADAAMLTKALQSTPDAFAMAGRRYAVIPIQSSGAFHPKIHLRLGSDKARLIVGSANATAAGWCRNLELVAAIDLDIRDQQAQTGPLIRKAYDYLTHWLRGIPSESMRYKCRLIERNSPWLQDYEPNTGDIELPDGSGIDLFCEAGSGSPSMMQQFLGRIAGEKVRRLIVISPYWDKDLRGLRELRKALPGCPVSVVLHPEKSSFPIDQLGKKDEVNFVSLQTESNADAKRFPHAKLILIETTAADHVLVGSANCTDDALGTRSGPARNSEVSLYRRLKPGTVRDILGLDLTVKLERSAIAAPIEAVQSAAEEQAPFDAGHLERISGAVVWYPAKGIEMEAAGARLVIDKTEIPMTMVQGQWRTPPDRVPALLRIARVILKSGRVSRPLIIHDENELRRAAPGRIDGRLREAFERIRTGLDDILELAQCAHIIFAPDSSRVMIRPGTGGGGRREKPLPAGKAYGTSEEFRQAVSLEAATGRSGRYSIDDPGLLHLLSIVTRGVTPGDDAQDDELDRALDAGDREDGDEKSPEDADADQTDGQARQPISGTRRFTAEDLLRRQKNLMKAMDAYQDLLSACAKGKSKVSSRLAAQSVFMIQLMALACTLEHRLDEGQPGRLMVIYPGHESERERSFALRVARMLKSIWMGEESIAAKVYLQQNYPSLPDDIFDWIVISRWAIARAYLDGRHASGLVPAQIEKLAKQVYSATADLGPIAQDAESERMKELDAGIGKTPDQTEALLRFAAMTRNAPI
jgi:hypothetical protein